MTAGAKIGLLLLFGIILKLLFVYLLLPFGIILALNTLFNTGLAYDGVTWFSASLLIFMFSNVLNKLKK